MGEMIRGGVMFPGTDRILAQNTLTIDDYAGCPAILVFFPNSSFSLNVQVIPSLFLFLHWNFSMNIKTSQILQ